MKYFYNKNLKILKKEITEDIKQWKDIPCCWICIIMWKWLYYQYLFYKFNKVPNKILVAYFTGLGKNNMKIHMEPQKIMNIQSYPKELKLLEAL